MAKEEQKTYIVPSDKQPTFWNRDMAVGLALAAIVTPYFGFLPVEAGVSLAIKGLGFLGGAALGGYAGVKRMEAEKEHGKEVAPPSFWNKTTIVGAGIGSVVAPLAALAVGVAGVALGFGAGALLGEGIGLAVGAAGVVGGIGTFLAGPFIGGYFGGNAGKERLTKEYEAAQEYTRSHELGQAHSKNREQENTYQISPEEAKLLEVRMNSPRDANIVHAIDKNIGASHLV